MMKIALLVRYFTWLFFVSRVDAFSSVEPAVFRTRSTTQHTSTISLKLTNGGGGSGGIGGYGGYSGGGGDNEDGFLSDNFLPGWIRDQEEEKPQKIKKRRSNNLVLASSLPYTALPPTPWQALIAAALLLSGPRVQAASQLFSISLKSFTAWYLMQLQRSPLITKSITTAGIGFCGDGLAQYITHRIHQGKSNDSKTSSFSYDCRRGLSKIADGLLITGPVMHFGYNFFERIIPSGTSLAALSHIAADSIILDSAFVATALIVTGTLEGYSPQFVRNQFQKDFGSTLRAGWATSTLLLPVEFIFFRFLPLSLRTLAMNCTDVVWDAVVSFMAHQSRGSQTMECEL